MRQKKQQQLKRNAEGTLPKHHARRILSVYDGTDPETYTRPSWDYVKYVVRLRSRRTHWQAELRVSLKSKSER